MITITLNILAKDIEETNYFNSDDCAITKALNRAGYEYLEHTGIDFLNKNKDISFNPENHTDLSWKVQDMYNKIIPVENFTFSLEFPKEFLQ